MLKPSFETQAHAENPEVIFEQMRSEGNVVRVGLPIIGRVWMTVSHAATVSMLKDDKRFSMRKPGKNGGPGGLQWWMPGTIRVLANNMLTSDGDQHRRLRRIVDRSFQRRTVLDLEPMIREIAHNLLDQWPKEASVDLVGSYARKLPMEVICRLLGIDPRYQHQFASQAGKMTSVTGMLDMIRALVPIWRLKRLVEALLQEEMDRQDHSDCGSGLISELVGVASDGDVLSRDELIAMVFLLLMAGHETTTHAISTAVLALLEDDMARKWLLADASRYDLAIEEFLRFNSPVQFSKPRIDRAGGKFFGQNLSQGDMVMACLGAANRDPDHFEEPNRLMLSRHPNPHLEFGTGVHFCLGFQLARLEMQVALQVLFERFPRLTFVPQDTQWQQRMGLRALSRLTVQSGAP